MDRKNIFFKLISSLKNYHCMLLLAASAGICVLPLLIHQTLYVWHDIYFHLFQSGQFHKAISSGLLIPRWALDSNNGYGSPNFIFYSPLSYYVVSLFHLIIPSFIPSVIAAIWLSFYLSGISMYVMATKVTNRATSLLCAALYQIFPFHIFDLYFRGSLGELYAFIWFPFIFGYTFEIISSKRKFTTVSGLAISFAGLILTHLVSAFLVATIIFSYISIKLIFSQNRSFVLPASKAIIIGLGLSSYFLLPVLTEMKYIKIGYIFKYHYSDNFLLSFNNIFNHVNVCRAPLNIVILIYLSLFMIYALSFYKQCGKGSSDNLFFYGAIFLVALFMSTPLSKWVWNISTMMQKTQFPWRWVAYLELSLVFMTATFLTKARSSYLYSCSVYSRWTKYLLSILVMISFVFIFFNNNKINKQEINSLLFPEQEGYHIYKINLPLEYTPIWATDLDDRLKLPPPERVSTLSGNAISRIISWEPERRLIHFESSLPSVLRVATFYYPGWQAEIDGTSKTITVENGSGAMLIDVMPGKHNLTMKFVDTPSRISAKFISLFFGLFLIFYILRTKSRKNISQETQQKFS